jgi:hypothetical protein
VAGAAAEARLDGLVLEGEFPDGAALAAQIETALRSLGSEAVVIRLSSAAEARRGKGAVMAAEGVTPGVNKSGDSTTASATAGLWVDSNLWLGRSLRPAAGARPVWIGHRPAAGSPEVYARSVADAAAAGARWIVALDDPLRAGLLERDPKALATWRGIAAHLAFYEEHADWRGFTPFGNVAIIFDSAGANAANSEEYLNLVARRQIPYRVVYRSELNAHSLEGLRAVLAFDLAPPTAAEREILRAFAARGGSVLIGPGWGGAPKEQSYTVAAVEQGEVAIYKDAAPDPEAVARDLNDLLTTPDFGVSVFNAPSMLSVVTAPQDGKRLLLQFVNYATLPAQNAAVWIEGKFGSARFYAPGAAPADLPLKKSGSRTEVAVPKVTSSAAVLLEP